MKHEYETRLANIGVPTKDNRALSAEGQWTFHVPVPVFELGGKILGSISDIRLTEHRTIAVRGIMQHFEHADDLNKGVRMLNAEWSNADYWKDPLTETMWFRRGWLRGALLVPAEQWAWA